MTGKIRPIRIDGDIAYVTLNTGREVMFDADKVHLVERYNWSDNGNGYVIRFVKENGKQRNVYLHRVLIEAPDGMSVDHINGDKSDDRLSNLRICTKAQNMANRGATRVNTSGFKGVRAHRRKWRAKITVDGHTINLGTYATPEEAHAAYAEASIKHHGEFARAA